MPSVSSRALGLWARAVLKTSGTDFPNKDLPTDNGLLKCEVKMAGYWPSSFFACLWTETESRSI